MHLILNGTPWQAEVATVRDVVGDLPPGQAVAVNGEVVPRRDHACHAMTDGDNVEIVTAVAGG